VRHHRSDAYSAEQVLVLLNKRQIYGGTPKVNCYRTLRRMFNGKCRSRQDYRIGTARNMSVDIDATPDLLLLIQQTLHIVQYRYCSLAMIRNGFVNLPLSSAPNVTSDSYCQTLTVTLLILRLGLVLVTKPNVETSFKNSGQSFEGLPFN